MHKKDGFTVIELVVGMALLGVVTVFMLVSIVDLKNIEEAGGVDTKALLNQALVSSKLNQEFNEHGLNTISNPTSQNGQLLSTVTFNFKASFKIKDLETDATTTTNNKILGIYGIETGKGATSIYYGADADHVEFKRTLPKGFYYQKPVVESIGTRFKKVVIPVKHESNSNLNFDIEAYYYPGQEVRDHT